MRVCYFDQERASFATPEGEVKSLTLDGVLRTFATGESPTADLRELQEAWTGRAFCPIPAVYHSAEVLELVQREIEWERYGEPPFPGPRDSWPAPAVRLLRLARQTNARLQNEDFANRAANRSGNGDPRGLAHAPR